MELKPTKMSNLKKWDTAHCFVLFVGGIIFWFTQLKLILILSMLSSFIYLFISEQNLLRKFRPFAGYANLITAIRLLGIMVLFSFADNLVNLQITSILIILISLDGLDGFLARRFKQVTDFGGIFDMETDSLFVCLTSILLFERGLIGAWILLIGFFRYFYVVLISFLGLAQFTEKRTKFGPTIAVLLFIAVIIPFALPQNIYMPCLIIASTLVSLSFIWSFCLLIVEKRKSIV